jgi:hypothetical protein
MIGSVIEELIHESVQTERGINEDEVNIQSGMANLQYSTRAMRLNKVSIRKSVFENREIHWFAKVHVSHL